MNNNEAREKILAIINEKKRVSPPEINYATKGKLPLVQIYAVAKKLSDEGIIVIQQEEKNKFYVLGDKSTSTKSEPVKAESEKSKKSNSDEGEEKSTRVKAATGGRDLTRYKFNGLENLSKGRLALAIVAQYAKDRRPSLKAALEMFPDTIVAPYGFIKPASEAKRLSKERARFFVRPEELIKLKDETVAVSNQMTPDRIAQVISIATKELKYKIK